MALYKNKNSGRSAINVYCRGRRTLNPIVFLFYLCLVFFVELPVAGADSNPASDIVLIANHSVIRDEYRTRTIRAIFGLKLTTWPNGRAITVFVRNSDSQVHIDFCREILRMLPYRLTRNWDRLLFSGTGMIPETVDSDEEMLKRVAETPGAIGYVSIAKVDDTVSVLEVK